MHAFSALLCRVLLEAGANPLQLDLISHNKKALLIKLSLYSYGIANKRRLE
jgi:hypothetical protein